jgi:TonB family protein
VRTNIGRWILLETLLLSCLAPAAFARCQPPPYQIGHIVDDSPSRISMNISLPIRYFARGSLICLVGALRERYSTHTQMSVLMFSSRKAAQKFLHPLAYPWTESLKPEIDWSEQEHAEYSFDAATHENKLYMMPFGGERKFATEIDLPVTSPHECNLELRGRCLLAADKIEYPQEALEKHIFGEVTLVGIITRDGAVSRVELAVSKERSVNGELSDAAIASLRTWNLEPATHEDTVRITYSYKIQNLGLESNPQIEFALPDEVFVTAAEQK